MLVFIAGQHRSGSTFSFNIGREVLLTQGSVGQASDNSLKNHKDAVTAHDHFILKSHDLGASERQMLISGQAISIVTQRQPLDAIASFMDCFKFDREAAFESFQAWNRMHREIAPYSTIIPYSLVEKRPGRAAGIIARAISPSISAVSVAHICRRHTKRAVMEQLENLIPEGADAVDIGFSYYDRSSFYHRRHVSGLAEKHARNRLSPEDISWITQKLLEREVH